jgi:hypothetical protein
MKEAGHRPQPGENQTLHEGGLASPGLPKPTEEPNIHRKDAIHDNRRLEKMRALSEKDPNLFARRAMQALDWLLNKRVSHAQQVDEGNR